MSHSTFVCAILLSPIVVLGQDSWIPWCEHPDGAGGFVCHYYRLTGIVDTWDEAETQAVAAGGHLVTINDSAENQFLYKTFCPATVPILHKWIGFFQDKADGTFSEPAGGWKWVSDPAFCRWNVGNPDLCYTNWWPLSGGEPNDSGGGENWGEMSCSQNPSDGGFWNDHRQAPAEGAPTQPGIIERDSLDGKIPAVSQWGMVAMTLLVLAAGTIVLMKRRAMIAA